MQVIPHVTNEIKAAVRSVRAPTATSDVVICEIGGTVGDIESLPFLEAIRQLRHELGRENTLFVHVTLVPWIAAAQELKTKPTQHSVKELRAIGIQPDILLCRTERLIPQDMKEKIALFCDVDVEAVITATDVDSVYEVPLTFAEQGVDEIVLRLLRIDAGRRATSAAGPTCCDRIKQSARRSVDRPGRQVRRVRGFLQEPERSPAARRPGARRSRSTSTGSRPNGSSGPSASGELEGFDGILVPGGFGKRGIEGMLQRHPLRARIQGPLFRHLPGHADHGDRVRAQRLRAGSTPTPPSSIPATPHRVIYKLRELKGVDELGGTMRLGAYPCQLARRQLRAPGLRHGARSASATATATNSIASTKNV